jgi:hypothetical protein
LATAAHRLGVTLRTHTPVTGLTLGSHGEHLVHTAANLAKTSFPPVRKYPTVFHSEGGN